MTLFEVIKLRSDGRGQGLESRGEDGWGGEYRVQDTGWEECWVLADGEGSHLRTQLKLGSVHGT